MKHYNIPKFQHIIVDEAQDIDDNRADIIKHMYASRAPLSLSIFGDPCQRINANSGKWYSDLWSKSQYQVTMFKLFPETAYDDPDAIPDPKKLARGLEEKFFVEETVVEHGASLIPIADHHHHERAIFRPRGGDSHPVLEIVDKVVLHEPIASLPQLGLAAQFIDLQVELRLFLGGLF